MGLSLKLISTTFIAVSLYCMQVPEPVLVPQVLNKGMKVEVVGPGGPRPEYCFSVPAGLEMGEVQDYMRDKLSLQSIPPRFSGILQGDKIVNIYSTNPFIFDPDTKSITITVIEGTDEEIIISMLSGLGLRFTEKKTQAFEFKGLETEFIFYSITAVWKDAEICQDNIIKFLLRISEIRYKETMFNQSNYPKIRFHLDRTQLSRELILKYWIMGFRAFDLMLTGHKNKYRVTSELRNVRGFLVDWIKEHKASLIRNTAGEPIEFDVGFKVGLSATVNPRLLFNNGFQIGFSCDKNDFSCLKPIPGCTLHFLSKEEINALVLYTCVMDSVYVSVFAPDNPNNSIFQVSINSVHNPSREGGNPGIFYFVTEVMPKLF